MSTFLAGFGLGLSLIVAIGAQNAFILRAGLLRQHVFVLCSVCAVSDALLIAAGVLGLGVLVGKVPFFLDFMKYAGASFLFAYGLRSLLKSFTGGRFLVAEGEANSLKEAIVICLILTSVRDPSAPDVIGIEFLIGPSHIPLFKSDDRYKLLSVSFENKPKYL